MHCNSPFSCFASSLFSVSASPRSLRSLPRLASPLLAPAPYFPPYRTVYCIISYRALPSPNSSRCASSNGPASSHVRPALIRIFTRLSLYTVLYRYCTDPKPWRCALRASIYCAVLYCSRNRTDPRPCHVSMRPTGTGPRPCHAPREHLLPHANLVNALWHRVEQKGERGSHAHAGGEGIPHEVLEQDWPLLGVVLQGVEVLLPKPLQPGMLHGRKLAVQAGVPQDAPWQDARGHAKTPMAPPCALVDVNHYVLAPLRRVGLQSGRDSLTLLRGQPR
jgi:hypothetical protein